MPTSKCVKFLIVDTSAFINNVQMRNFGENILTIPEVIAEVRNKRQYRHLFSLTHDVEFKDVFSESITFVTEFAKKTGDYASLSAVDIKLIALTYQMEIENVGRDHLRTEPVIAKYDVNVKTRTTEVNKDPLSNGLCLPTNIKSYPKEKSDCGDDTCTGKDDEDDSANESVSDNECDFHECLEQEYFEEEEIQDENEYLEESESDVDDQEDSESDVDYQRDSESDVNDGIGWITPNNFNELRKASNNSHAEEKPVSVGCMSTDFAIQNVLMQIGLNVVTVDGRIIRELRSYILRCYACFATTTNIKKIFCQKCGNKTLKRVSVYIDKDGIKRMFINFKKPITTRGKRFPLPLPKGGKHAVNPRLVEDARRPHQKPSRLARTKTDALQDDYIAGNSPFVLRDVHSRSAQHGFNKGKYVFKNWMRRNPNEARRNPK